jgi:hypothetical protein
VDKTNTRIGISFDCWIDLDVDEFRTRIGIVFDSNGSEKTTSSEERNSGKLSNTHKENKERIGRGREQVKAGELN